MNIDGFMAQVRKYGLGMIVIWTGIIAAILLFIINVYRENTIKEATREARDYHALNLQYRKWGARLGGVYAPADKVVPNPYLTVPERDVKTESGKSLTLVNPAYMTRMVFEAIVKESKEPVVNRLVSLKPLNPANVPNAWERETLGLFENRLETERTQVIAIDNKPYLQFMAAFITEESCLKCHAHQGYHVGDVRGGMSIAIPMGGYLEIEAERRNSLVAGFALLWLLGGAGIAASSTRRHRQEMALLENAGGGYRSNWRNRPLSWKRKLRRGRLRRNNLRSRPPRWKRRPPNASRPLWLFRRRNAFSRRSLILNRNASSCLTLTAGCC